jgi:hypothetical protein
MVATFWGELCSSIGLWGVFLLWAGLLSSPLIYFGRHRAQWEFFELSVFILPIWSWAICWLINDKGKSLSNLAVELITLVLCVPLAALVRVVVGHPAWRWRVSAAMIGAITVLAVCLWAFVPGLPE